MWRGAVLPSTDLSLLQAGIVLLLGALCGAAVLAPALYWVLLGTTLAAALGLLAYRQLPALCAVWLLVAGATPEMALNDLVGPAAFQATIAAVKGGAFLLASACIWRWGLRRDVLNPAWGFVAIGAWGPIHGLHPGLSLADSLRSLFGSVAPYVFGFARLPLTWCNAILWAVPRAPIVAVAGGAVLATLGLRPLFVESGGWRLAGLGHPAFLAGVCLPAVYAALIAHWRDGRPRNAALLGTNLVILVLTGARAPLAYACGVVLLTLLAVPSPHVSLHRRAVLLLGGALLLVPLLLFAQDLTAVRVFNLLTNDLGNLSGREYLWPSFRAAAAQSPWFGWGLGAGNVIIPPESQVARLLHTWAAHNEYLRMEVEGGQIGRLLLVALFVLWVMRRSAVLARGERWIIRLAFLAFAAHAFTDNVLISTPACVLFAFATAIFARGECEAAMRSALRPGARKA